MIETWKLLAIVGPLFFVIYQTLSKLLPKTTSTFLINAYASLVGAIVMFLLHLIFSTNKSILISQRQIIIVVGIGIMISMGNFFIIRAYSLGASQALFTSIFYPVLIGLSILFGFVIWHEKISLVQAVGVILSIIGMILITYFKK